MSANNQHKLPDTAIHNAVESDLVEYLKQRAEENNEILLLRSDLNESILHKAAYYGAAKTVLWLVKDAGMEIDIRDNYKYTPLHEAARGGRLDTCEVLLSLGADATLRTHDNKGVLDVAASTIKTDLAGLMQNATPWKKTGDNEVVQGIFNRHIGYCFTNVFNFSARTCTMITRNTATNAESMAVKSFSDVSEGDMILQAEQAFLDLGGTLPEGYRAASLKKTALARPD